MMIERIDHDINGKIKNIFPRVADIPKSLLNDIPFIRKEYLVNGEIKVRPCMAKQASNRSVEIFSEPDRRTIKKRLYMTNG